MNINTFAEWFLDYTSDRSCFDCDSNETMRKRVYKRALEAGIPKSTLDKVFKADGSFNFPCGEPAMLLAFFEYDAQIEFSVEESVRLKINRHKEEAAQNREITRRKEEAKKKLRALVKVAAEDLFKSCPDAVLVVEDLSEYFRQCLAGKKKFPNV